MPIQGGALVVFVLIAVSLWTGHQVKTGAKYVYSHTIGRVVHLVHHTK